MFPPIVAYLKLIQSGKQTEFVYFPCFTHLDSERHFMRNQNVSKTNKKKHKKHTQNENDEPYVWQ